MDLSGHLAGSKEGQSCTNDFPAVYLGINTMRGHVLSMHTLGLEALAKQTLDVSFVHDYPGFVATEMSQEIKGIGPAIMKVMLKPIMAMLRVPIDEVGEALSYTLAKYEQ